MKRFSAQYIITNSGPVLKRAIISTEDDGTIISVDDTGGDLKETNSVEFYNGIIIPGFVNCHSHLELSHLKGVVAQNSGLGVFIDHIRSSRAISSDRILSSASSADKDMYNSGISLCADICNTSDTFLIKGESKIRYISLLEVFGIDPDKASGRMEEIIRVSQKAEEMNLPFSLVPHSTYSVSLTLFRTLLGMSMKNKVTSIHFMESAGEKEFLVNKSGPLMISYRKSGLLPSTLETVKDHAAAVLNEVTGSGNLILVHNTFADRHTIRSVMKRKNLYWCLCPGSNAYIETSIPPVNLLLEEGCEIVIGTDSLASNIKLDILGELIALQSDFPDLAVEDLVRWATLNGAKALG